METDCVKSWVRLLDALTVATPDGLIDRETEGC